MSMAETDVGAVSEYVPFTPFQESYEFEPEPATSLATEVDVAPPATPFVSEYGGVQEASPVAEDLRELLFQLYDEEFDDVLAEMAHEAWEAATERAQPFGETVASASTEEFLRRWSQPVREQAETILDNIAEAAAQTDLAALSESEIDAFFAHFEPHDTGLETYFEDFLGKLVSKAKSIAQKAVDVAKKGIALVPGISGLISKLKGLVRPLLDRVLRMAIDKLPPTLRPLARQLAQRVLAAGAGAGESESEDLEAVPAAPDVSAIQQQFDLEAAQLLFASDEIEQEVALSEASGWANGEGEASLAELHQARARFVDDLEAGVDPQQALEQFIPAVMAVMPVARTVIRVIGRQRVVNILAGFLAGYIGRFVAPAQATQLSRAIVDTGLRMLSLEAPVEEEARGPRLACETIAQTVEDTVRRLGEVGEADFEEPVLFEAALAEAFQEAAAENFPPEMLRPELQETALRATWVTMPAGARRKLYKKFTQVFDVQLTPQVADSVATFGGARLAAALRDQLGVTLPVRARVHLYQAISGTTLRRIASAERNVPGLGGARNGAAMLHPLTVEAATALLQQPKLGRDIPGRFLSSRGAIAAGGRFYYLEIAGARPLAAIARGGARSAVRRTSQVNVTLDFPKDEFRVFVYLSEPEAQEIAARVRAKDLTSGLVLAKRVYGAGVSVALGGQIQRHVKILTEAVPQEEFLGKQLKQLTENARVLLVRTVVDYVGQALAAYFRTSAGEFVAATEDTADGATLVVRIVSPPGGPLVRKLLRGEGIGPGSLGDLASAFKGKPKLSVQTVPGYRFD